MDSIPMVVLTGQVPSHAIGSDAFQEVDAVGVTRPCVKHNFLVKDLDKLAENPTTDNNEDIVTQLGKVLTANIMNKQIGFISFARSVLKAVTDNELNLYFPDSNLEALAYASGLSGKIDQGECHPQLGSLCQADTVYLNETNFSVAKTNYYLKRVQSHTAEIKPDGSIINNLVYNYSFPVPAPTSLSQNYKAYYQLYLPSGHSSLTITLDNQSLNPSGFSQTQLGDLAKIEFSASMALNQNHDLKVSFVSPVKVDLQKAQIAYSLNFEKQAGTNKDQFSFALKYPGILVPRVMTLPMKEESAGELVYQTDSPGRLTFGILFKNSAI